MLPWSEKRKLYADWQVKAKELIADGYKRQPDYNPNIPTTFTKDGQTVFLVRLTPQAEWTVKVKEPLENQEALFNLESTCRPK